MTPVLLFVAGVAICLVIKHAPWRWLNDRPADPHGQARGPAHVPHRGGTATPHTTKETT